VGPHSPPGQSGAPLGGPQTLFLSLSPGGSGLSSCFFRKRHSDFLNQNLFNFLSRVVFCRMGELSWPGPQGGPAARPRQEPPLCWLPQFCADFTSCSGRNVTLQACFWGLWGRQSPQVKKCHESIFKLLPTPVFYYSVCICSTVVSACSSRLERKCRVVTESWENRFSGFCFCWCPPVRVGRLGPCTAQTVSLASQAGELVHGGTPPCVGNAAKRGITFWKNL